ncbi:alkaline phosphatase family protein [Elusimicrobiota bacterium]
MNRKVVIIGWDCAAPLLVFNRFREDLKNTSRITAKGCYGKLRSVIPPITIPAWRCMVTGKTPGELGLWGFRHRIDNSYSDFSIPTSNFLKSDAIWDILGRHGKKSICSSVPPSYPPYEVNGHLIGCFMTPDTSKAYTYPAGLRNEINSLVGDYQVDTVFRVEDKNGIKKSAFEMTDKHFTVFEHLLRNKEWDFAMHVEIGLDRIQHAFWRYLDETHHLHEAFSEYKDVILDYYRLLDERLGRIMELIDEETLLLVVSDHGAKAMKGAFCVNQWLINEGYLKLNSKPEPGQRIQNADVDWKRSKAWGWGGYYSRIFFNVKGRERQGRISSRKLPKEIERLKKKIV